MKQKQILLSLFLMMNICAFCQQDILPKTLTIDEQIIMDDYLINPILQSDIITTPPSFEVRTMAEWEEIQALTIAWEGYEPILTEIVRNSVDQCKVLIACDNPNDVNDYLLASNVNVSNVEYLTIATNSIWMRDYGQNTVYKNDVDSLYLVDWIYNRPRPDDDTYPEYLAEYLDLDLYQTSVDPYRFIATGGNFMSDGFGTAFSSHLITDENDGSGPYSLNYPLHNEEEINNLMSDFMGIDTYIKMPTLPYDGINHIDMHIKLLDEETLLVSEYPEGVSDGPQIEENLEFILDNYTTKWGTPFKVIRIPSPPSTSGAYPGSQPGNTTDGYYRTYTNSVFVNKTVILPFYREEYDTIAQRIYEEALPGYNIVGIDCDNNGNNIISLSGAIHCITHSVGVNDPLLISYKKIEDTCPASDPIISFESLIKHRSGINQVFFNYRYEGFDSFSSLEMEDLGNGLWGVDLDFEYNAENIEYYVNAIANNGKEQYRPMTALNGGVNSFIYSINECDGSECFQDFSIGCDFDSIWDPVCGCDGITYSNYGDATCNNIFYWTQGACDNTVGLFNNSYSLDKKLIKITDITGREIKSLKDAKIHFLIFNDGTVEKKFIN